MTPPPTHTIPILKKQERQSWLFWLFLQEIFIFLKSTQNNFPTKSQCWLKWLLHSNPRVLSLFTPVSYVPIDLYNSAFRFNHLNSLPISPAEKSSRYSHSPKLSLPFKNIHKQNWKNLYFWYIQYHPFQFIMEFLFLMEFLPKPEPEDSPSIEVELAMKVGSRISRGRMIRAASISPLLVSKPPPGLSVTEAESRSGTNTWINTSTIEHWYETWIDILECQYSLVIWRNTYTTIQYLRTRDLRQLM